MPGSLGRGNCCALITFCDMGACVVLPIAVRGRREKKEPKPAPACTFLGEPIIRPGRQRFAPRFVTLRATEQPHRRREPMATTADGDRLRRL